ncbi:hypothetical protein WQ59_17285 [Streptomyces sp. KE1]|nr:hypothetical protein WQ59_17285 [Streptomyces sp. KE1]
MAGRAVIGRLRPEVGTASQPPGDGFVRLIKAMIGPLVCVVVAGITKAGDLEFFGRMGLKAPIWFEAATTVALVLACLTGAALLHLGHTQVPAILPAIAQPQEVVFTSVGSIMRAEPVPERAGSAAREAPPETADPVG